VLKSEGYTSLDKNELIPLAALNVDKAFMTSMRKHYKDLTAHNLVTMTSSLSKPMALIKPISQKCASRG
jgi:EAL domain-containing protein (putative c-di-GMP-specific phosphodiesterase class I)